MKEHTHTYSLSLSFFFFPLSLSLSHTHTCMQNTSSLGFLAKKAKKRKVCVGVCMCNFNVRKEWVREREELKVGKNVRRVFCSKWKGGAFHFETFAYWSSKQREVNLLNHQTNQLRKKSWRNFEVVDLLTECDYFKETFFKPSYWNQK